MKNIKLLLQDALDVMDDLHIEVEPISDIKWNYRLKAVWGKCFRKNNIYWIELNPILQDDAVSWEDALNTVIHEVLHCHKDRFCHTGKWKRCADLINREYPIYHIERTTFAEEKGVENKIQRSYKYETRCLNCGHSEKWQRESRVIKALKRDSHSCRCSCGSNDIQLIILK